jgi:hypothetical protein
MARVSWFIQCVRAYDLIEVVGEMPVATPRILIVEDETMIAIVRVRKAG